MKQFSCTNFRKFENEITLNASDINILVGANNAGKSTLVKAMLVMFSFLKDWQRGANEIDFNSPILRALHIGDYYDLSNNQHKNDPVRMSATFQDIDIALEFIPGKGRRTRRFPEDAISLSQMEEKRTSALLSKCVCSSNSKRKFYLEIDYTNKYSDLKIPKRTIVSAIQREVSSNFILFSPLIMSSMKGSGDAGKFSNAAEEIFKEAVSWRTIEDLDELIVEQEKSFLDRKQEAKKFSSREKDPVNFWLSVSGQFEETSSKTVSALKFYRNVIKLIVDKDDDELISMDSVLKAGESEADIHSKIDSEMRIADILDMYTNIVEKEKELTLINEQIFEISRMLNRRIRELNFEYCNIFSLNQNKIHLTASNDTIPATVRVYNEALVGAKGLIGIRKASSFMKDWMVKTGLGVGFAIKPETSDAFTISIKKEDQTEVPLSDYGMGSIHLFVLLLKIISTYLQTKPMRQASKAIYSHMLIEEPEINLHPQKQSMLAEMLSEASEKFGIQFFIETHSEYLVRKLQQLVAKKTISTNSISMIYIYNSDETKPKETTSVFKPIHIKEDGSLDAPFGDGFYDEADKLAMSLLSINAGLWID